MWRLMEKFKNDEWKEVETLDENTQNIEESKNSLLQEYQEAFGRAYMFKWVKLPTESYVNKE